MGNVAGQIAKIKVCFHCTGSRHIKFKIRVLSCPTAVRPWEKDFRISCRTVFTANLRRMGEQGIPVLLSQVLPRGSGGGGGVPLASICGVLLPLARMGLGYPLSPPLPRLGWVSFPSLPQPGWDWGTPSSLYCKEPGWMYGAGGTPLVVT